MKKVAFIGTGLMGAPMAGHILDAGYELVVYNRTKARAQDLIDRGAKWAESPKEACKDADLVITIVGYPVDVEEVYLGEEGLIEHAKPGTILVDMSTSSPDLARDIHQAAAIRDIVAFDAPVTGGEDGAKAGTLTIMVGADEKTLDLVRPVFETFGKVIVAFGEAGKGQLAKMTNQIAIAGAMQAMAESLSFAKTVGIDPKQVLPILQSGSAGSVALNLYAPRALDGNFDPGFKVEHLRKDLNIALGIANDEGLTLPGLVAAYSVYDILFNIRGGAHGTQAITLVYDGEEAAEDAGLDWSALDEQHDEYFEQLSEQMFGAPLDEDEDKGHCSCGHHHGEDDELNHHHEHGRCCH